MILLLSSIVSLILGPVLVSLFSLHRNLFKAFDGFLLTFLGWVVCVDILPHSVEKAGWLVLGSTLLGFLCFYIGDKFFHRDKVHLLLMLFIILSLWGHSMADGVWIAYSDSDAYNHLALGIVIHRIPLGLIVWRIVKPNLGTKFACCILTIISLGTLTGYSYSADFLQTFTRSEFVHFQALIAGSLLHVVLHSLHYPNNNQQRSSRRSARRKDRPG